MGRFSAKGIVWLLLGIAICVVAGSMGTITDIIGMLLIGVTFIALFFFRQFFDTTGNAWFIIGGILTAFTVESFLEGPFATHSLDGDFTTVTITLIIAIICFTVFAASNKQ